MLTAALLAMAGSVRADCFDAAARTYHLDPALLRAVAAVESGFNADATNRSHFGRTGSIDIGLMQVNSRWLKPLGLTEQQLRDPCTNVRVGAWILADTVARHGNTWTAVGAYNAACTQLRGTACDKARAAYAWRVYRHLAAEARNPGPPKRARSAGLIAVSVADRNGADEQVMR